MPRAIWILPFLLVAGLGAGAAISKGDADQFQVKLTKISKNGHATRPAAMKTPVSESELNSYLTYSLGPTLPEGVSDPNVTILGDGRVSGRATVDLSRVKDRPQGGGWFDPFAYLGKTPIVAVGSLRSSEGTAQFDLESTTVSGLPVPSALLQSLVSYYSRTPENPDGIQLNAPFKLPVGIKEIQVGKGQAVIVQ